MLRHYLLGVCSHTTRPARIISAPLGRSFHVPHFRRFPQVFSKAPPKPIPQVPSFRTQVARSTNFESFSDKIKYPGIRDQIIFFTFGSLIAFTCAASSTNYDTEYWKDKLLETSVVSGLWAASSPTSDQMRKARYFEFAKSMQKGLNYVRNTVENFPLAIKSFATWSYIYVAQPLVDAKEGRRICWTIALVNTGVWLAWQIPRLKPFMLASFTHSPLSGLSYTMLTSVFSHKTFIHLLFNCMALASFGSVTCEYLMREQAQSKSGLQESTVQYHLIAFLISAGLFSSLVSHVATCRIRYPRLIAKVTKSSTLPAAAIAKDAAVKEGSVRSLGISGAVYSALALSALAYPESQVALIFPPTPPFSIQWGVGALVTMDILGLIRGWSIFDHYAHLGGAAFGVFYYAYGPQIWDFFRTIILSPYKPVPKNDSP